MTMRDKLIAQLQEMGVGCCQYAGDREVAAEIVDAILATLREPDEAMIDAYAEGVPVNDLHSPGEWNMKVEGYTALIDHVRSGK